MNSQQNPYVILGIPETATSEDIRTAYRRLARRLHPDVNPNHPAAARQFQDITSAYEILIDLNQKQEYDARQRSRPVTEDFSFRLDIIPSKRSIMSLKEPQVLYLLANILPDPRARDFLNQRESRLNLTLVLDHSNSMSGTRMEKVKIAAHQIIDNLEPDDIISIISFNDRAETVIPATYIEDQPSLKARVSMILPGGGTEIYQGLSAGLKQCKQYLSPKRVNHIVLLTDGHTFGDQDKCLELAKEAAAEGIGISAMGLGHDWNDQFLDDLASKTGGNSEYINSAGAVVRFLNDHVRNLSSAFAERLKLSIAPDSDIMLESAFRISPHPQPLSLEDGELLLGSLQPDRPVSVLLQFQMPGELSHGNRSIARLMAMGDIFVNEHQTHQAVEDFIINVTEDQVNEDPPTSILDALSKLTLYRLQERAQQALENGDVNEATKRLENLATRLFSLGNEELASQALLEARRVAHTNHFSDRGKKTLKYKTRYLLLDSDNGEHD